MFVNYIDVDGDSNVLKYEIGFDYISVIFAGTQKIYTYTYKSAGKNNVEIMKRLATNGENLNSFINTYCKYKYQR